MAVEFWRAGDLFHVRLANPPVNAINLETRDGLFAAITALQHETDLAKVVLSGGERIFAAGGDAREFDKPPVAPHLPDILAMIEASPVPWVAAINGAALGGGLELALACRYRIAHKNAQLGLPEVTLGVVPGAGGTQRLPRLIGFAAALDLITTGKPVRAAMALDLGLIDAIVDDPENAATQIPASNLAQSQPVSSRPNPQHDAKAEAATKTMIGRRMKDQIAPQKALQLVNMTCAHDFATGIQAERDCFLALRQSQQARALRHIFFAERGAKLPKEIDPDTALPITKVAVVGGGTMGAGIAHALLAAGIATVTLETDDASAQRAGTNAEALINTGMKRGHINEDRAAAMRSLHQISTDFDTAKDVSLVIEAVFEDMAVKEAVFRRLDCIVPANAVLATNTSYLDVDQLAATLDDPSRLIGLHFFVPAHVMKLLEIVRGAASSERALATGFALAKLLRKTPVLAGVCDGFIGNRILARYREAADSLLLDGASISQIDDAMVQFGYAMGPYAAQDMSGLDIAFANRRRQDSHRDPAKRYVRIADKMVTAGRLGRKTKKGWYRYDVDGTAQHDTFVDDLIHSESVAEGINRRHFSQDDIIHRLTLAMINEAAAILDEGIAQSAADIDLVTVLGYGFPRWRGGLMHYADTVGAANILTALEGLAAEDARAWTPNRLVRAAADSSFSSLTDQSD